jgi:predicted acylesterase/phospholipase RssA
MNDLKIGLAFSGGGFRAAAFNLGVLAYLNQVELDDGKLLQKVYSLSSISGGTITAARYALGISKGESFEQIYSDIYDFMSTVDLVDESLTQLVRKRKKEDQRIKSLITAFADIYDQFLFKGALLGNLLVPEIKNHLQHVSFNATEFANAMQFRFQKSKSAITGNANFTIPRSLAMQIRLADIMAASSCFPGGFEPINFPNDFVLPSSEALLNYKKKYSMPLGLMDGGIVDNQGIEPLLLLEERLKKQKAKVNDDTYALDLLIISDVTSPYMDDYIASKEQKLNFWRRLNFEKLMYLNLLILSCSIIGLIFSMRFQSFTSTVISTCVSTINLTIYGLLIFVKKLPRSFHIEKAFLKPLRKLMKVRFSIYENMILNRSNSLLQMTSEVFLKHIRRLNYNRIYKDKTWKNRRITNAIYELRSDEMKLKKRFENGTYPVYLAPSKKINEVSDLASNMGTTLWFSKEELKNEKMLKALIACGQFTMCWNFLTYIYHLKKCSENSNENHQLILTCEEQFLKDWEKFQKDPFWML